MTIIPQYTKSLKVYFNTCDETTCDSAYHMEYLDMDLECDTCGFMGSYYLDGEKYKIGQCSICLMKSGVVDKIIIDWMVYITNFANKDMNGICNNCNTINNICSLRCRKCGKADFIKPKEKVWTRHNWHLKSFLVIDTKIE